MQINNEHNTLIEASELVNSLGEVNNDKNFIAVADFLKKLALVYKERELIKDLS